MTDLFMIKHSLVCFSLLYGCFDLYVEETIVEEEVENELQDEVEVFEFLPQTQKQRKKKSKGKKGKKGHKKNKKVISRIVEKSKSHY